MPYRVSREPGVRSLFHVELNIGVLVIVRMDAAALDRFYKGDEATVNLDTSKAILFDVSGARLNNEIERADK